MSPKDVRIEFYENINGQGEKTSEMYLVYEQLDDERGTLNLTC